MKDSDFDIALFHAGDPKALQHIYSWYGFFVNVALKFLSRRDEAEDIVQISILKAYENRYKIINVGNLKGYITVSVKNKCQDFLRVNKNQRRYQRDYILTMRSILPPQYLQEEQDDMAQQKEAFKKSVEELEKLPPRRQQIMKEFFLEDGKISGAKLAVRLGIPQQNVYREIGIGLRQIKERISANG